MKTIRLLDRYEFDVDGLVLREARVDGIPWTMTFGESHEARVFQAALRRIVELEEEKEKRR